VGKAVVVLGSCKQRIAVNRLAAYLGASQAVVLAPDTALAVVVLVTWSVLMVVS